MIRRILRVAGRIIWWCAQPVMRVYLRDSKRTRLVLRNDRGQLLLVRGWISSSNRWSLPGGGMHRGEEPLTGLLREVHEEVGLSLRPEDISLLGDFQINSKGFRFYLYFFMATISGQPELHLQKLEIAEAAWVDALKLTPATAEPDVLWVLTLLAERG